MSFILRIVITAILFLKKVVVIWHNFVFLTLSTAMVWGFIVPVIIFLTPDSFGGDNSPLSDRKLDVVLVIDSSGSMKVNDPEMLRVYAARLFVNLLGESERIGVVGFHEEGYPLIPLTPVDKEENKLLVYSALKKITSAGRFTNLYEALAQGIRTLKDEKSPTNQKILILLTDGIMDTGNQEQDKKLEKGIREDIIPELKGKNIRVFTIAFTEHSDKAFLEEIARKSEGFYSFAHNAAELHEIATVIFEKLKKSDTVPVNALTFDKDSFKVDNEIKEITLVITKSSRNVAISLQNPDGEIYTKKTSGANIAWFVSASFDMVTIKKPVAGTWNILSSTGRNNKAYIITDLKLQSDFNVNFTEINRPLKVHVWIERSGIVLNEAALNEEEFFSKDGMVFTLTLPDGEMLDVPHSASETAPLEQKGGYVYTGSFIPAQPGTHKLTITAQGKTFTREKTFLFTVHTPLTTQGTADAPPVAMLSSQGQVQKQASQPPQIPELPSPVKDAPSPAGQGQSLRPQAQEESGVLSLSTLFKLILLNAGVIFIVIAVLKLRRMRKRRENDKN